MEHCYTTAFQSSYFCTYKRACCPENANIISWINFPLIGYVFMRLEYRIQIGFQTEVALLLHKALKSKFE